MVKKKKKKKKRFLCLKETFHKYYVSDAHFFPSFSSFIFSLQDPNFQWGNAHHGYDNKLMDMKSILFAQGPSFKKGYRARNMESVSLSYPLRTTALFTISMQIDISDSDSDSTLFNHGGPTSTQGGSSLGPWVQCNII